MVRVCGESVKKKKEKRKSRGKERVGAAAAAGARTEKSSQVRANLEKERNAVVETRSVSVTHRDASDAVLPQPVATVRPVPLNTAEYHPQFSQSIMLVSSPLPI